jgi:hypothetical protein
LAIVAQSLLRPERYGTSSYADVMTAQREELQRLVDELPEEQVSVVLADVRRHLAIAPDTAWPLAWFGSATGTRTDTSARVDEILAEGFGRG